MGPPPGSVVRAFFTLLALVVVCLPIVGWLGAGHTVRWGTVPEWIGAIALVVMAAGVWRLARDREPVRRGDDVRR